jgi:hypothetical protein
MASTPKAPYPRGAGRSEFEATYLRSEARHTGILTPASPCRSKLFTPLGRDAFSVHLTSLPLQIRHTRLGGSGAGKTMTKLRFSQYQSISARFGIASAAAFLALGIAGCKSNSGNAPIITNSATGSTGTTDSSNDPAAGNLAAGSSSGGSTQVMGTSSSYTPQRPELPVQRSPGQQ